MAAQNIDFDRIYGDFNDFLHAYDRRHMEEQVRFLYERFEQRKIENGPEREMEGLAIPKMSDIFNLAGR